VDGISANFCRKEAAAKNPREEDVDIQKKSIIPKK
jgi:hypothetical protein